MIKGVLWRFLRIQLLCGAVCTALFDGRAMEYPHPPTLDPIRKTARAYSGYQEACLRNRLGNVQADMAFLNFEDETAILTLYRGQEKVFSSSVALDPSVFPIGIGSLCKGNDGCFYTILSAFNEAQEAGADLLLRIDLRTQTVKTISLDPVNDIQEIRSDLEAEVLYVIGRQPIVEEEFGEPMRYILAMLDLKTLDTTRSSLHDIPYPHLFYQQSPATVILSDASRTLTEINIRKKTVEHNTDFLKEERDQVYWICYKGRIEAVKTHDGGSSLIRLNLQKPYTRQTVPLPLQNPEINVGLWRPDHTYVVENNRDASVATLVRVGGRGVDNQWDISLPPTQEKFESILVRHADIEGTVYLAALGPRDMLWMSCEESLIRVSTQQTPAEIFHIPGTFSNSNGWVLYRVKGQALYYISQNNTVWRLGHHSQTPEQIPVTIPLTDRILGFEIADDGTVYMIARPAAEEAKYLLGLDCFPRAYGIIVTPTGEAQKISNMFMGNMMDRACWSSVQGQEASFSSWLIYYQTALQNHRRAQNNDASHVQEILEAICERFKSWDTGISLQDGEKFFELLNQYWLDEDSRLSSAILDLIQDVTREITHPLAPYALGFLVEHTLPSIFLQHPDFGTLDAEAVQNTTDYAQKLERTHWTDAALDAIRAVAPDWYQAGGFGLYSQYVKRALETLGKNRSQPEHYNKS